VVRTSHGTLHNYSPRHSEITTPKFDNRKKIDFFKTIIDFWKKTKLTSLVTIDAISISVSVDLKPGYQRETGS